MASTSPSASSSAQIICLFPDAPASTHAAFGSEDQTNLTAAELRAVRQAVIRLPLPWFRACEQNTADLTRGSRWDFAYVRQITGPFIANFTITRNDTDFTVCLDDGQHPIDEWDGFLTIDDAVAVIGYYVEWVLTGWGLRAA